VTKLSAILFLAGAGLAFIVAGYPLLVAVLARWRPKPVSYGRDCPIGGLRRREIRSKLESILRLDYPRRYMRILMISDGSTDQTDGIVTEFRAKGVALLCVPHGGKAAALNAGMARATGAVLFFTDGRQHWRRMRYATWWLVWAIRRWAALRGALWS